MGWCQRGPPDLALEGGKPQIVGDVAYGAARNLSGFACDDSLVRRRHGRGRRRGGAGARAAGAGRRGDAEEDTILGLIDEPQAWNTNRVLTNSRVDGGISPASSAHAVVASTASRRGRNVAQSSMWPVPASRRRARHKPSASRRPRSFFSWARASSFLALTPGEVALQPSDLVEVLHVLPGQIFGLFLGLVLRLPLEVGQLLAAHALHALFAATALEAAAPLRLGQVHADALRITCVEIGFTARASSPRIRACPPGPGHRPTWLISTQRITQLVRPGHRPSPAGSP